ncbi:MAG: extracellular solute-binding protein [Planctomycetota bacterium]|nr:extracellular solute-binding protein [Planctomycetota bacterium]
MWPRRAILAAAISFAAFAGCDREGVTVYYSVDSAFADPILDDFEKRTGIKVHRVPDSEAGKTTGLVNRLLSERESPRADVWWSGEVFGTIQLASAGILAPYKPPTASDIPERYRDPAGLWTAFGLRGRVLAYDPKRTTPDQLPRRWSDLADPRFKGRFHMADPRFGTTRGHMATLYALWGPDALATFCRQLRKNDTGVGGGNAQAVLLLNGGAAELIATDTDDVIVAQQRGDSIEMIYPDLDCPGDSRTVPGTLWIPCSVALVAGGPQPQSGRRLVDFLASAEIEKRLYQSASRNVPVRPALRKTLDIDAPKIAPTDYAAAAATLPESDALMQDLLLP